MSNNNSVEISFFIPCRNEQGNIIYALDTFRSVAKHHDCSSEVIVVDDGSVDGTDQQITDYCAKNKDVPIIFHRNLKSCGVGRNYYHWAKQARGKYYMLIRGCDDIPAEDLSAIVALRGTADVIVPYVVNQNERPLIRNILSRLFTVLVNLLSGHQLKYYNGPVLHLRENVIRFKPRTSGFAYQAEILCQALNNSCSFVEVPFRSVKRKYGRSSSFRPANIASVFKSFWRILVSNIANKIRKSRIRWPRKSKLISSLR